MDLRISASLMVVSFWHWDAIRAVSPYVLFQASTPVTPELLQLLNSFLLCLAWNAFS
jgi:hypothetical protein